MLKFSLLSMILLVGIVTYSQNITQKDPTKEKLTNLNINQEIAEPIPDPLEQGFQMVEENGKVFYRKEVNGIIIEFKPEEL